MNPTASTSTTGYERVLDLFEGLLAARPEVSRALCVYVDGRPVLDLWGGPRYDRDSAQLLFSVTKGLTAMCAGVLIDRGLLDPDAPVARYWPEFAAEGKDATTVRWLLSHQAGLPTVHGGFTLAEVIECRPLADRLARQRPYWEPGAAHGYHSLTYGTLAAELVRRITGSELGDFFAEHVAGPLGAETWYGLPDHQRHRYVPLVAPTEPPPADDPSVIAFADPGSLSRRAFPSDWADGSANNPQFTAARQGAFSGFSTARGLARLYAACVGEVDGHRLLGADTAALLSRTQTQGPDLIGLEVNAFGLGFQVPFARLPYAGPGSFGHDGMGGCLAFASPAHGLGFGYITDHMPAKGGADPDAWDLVTAVLGIITGDCA